MNRLVLIFLFAFFFLPALAQWVPQSVGTNASFRAVHALSEQVCWIGGTRGTVLRTTDGGATWQNVRVPGADSLDFRDVHAFDAQTAIALSAGPAEQGAARLYRTTDGGSTWNLVFETKQKGVFLDGLDFWNPRHGLAFGDPVDGKFYLLATDDGGQTWRELPRDALPPVLPNEAAFAASGTSLVVAGTSHAWIGTGGGTSARVFRSTDRGRTWQVSDTGLRGGELRGIWGLRFRNKKRGIALGGSYGEPTAPPPVIQTRDGGRVWQPAQVPPTGLLECAALVGKRGLLVVGRAGTAYSPDFGTTWLREDDSAFHAVSVAGKTGWAVGAKGAVGKWQAGWRVYSPLPLKRQRP
jgi:photosystem II stability/assembly factor-like uncharacterized protein